MIEGYSYCDGQDLDSRADGLKRHILPNCEERSDGLITMQELATAENTLDIGCGRGAYGKLIRELGLTGKLTGVDATRYNTGNAYDQYDAIHFDSIDDILEELGDQEFDIIVGIGLPPQVRKFISQNRERFKLTLNGKMLIVTDDELQRDEKEYGNTFLGSTVINRNIIIYERPFTEAEQEERREAYHSANDLFYRQISPKLKQLQKTGREGRRTADIYWHRLFEPEGKTRNELLNCIVYHAMAGSSPNWHTVRLIDFEGEDSIIKNAQAILQELEQLTA